MFWCGVQTSTCELCGAMQAGGCIKGNLPRSCEYLFQDLGSSKQQSRRLNIVTNRADDPLVPTCIDLNNDLFPYQLVYNCHLKDPRPPMSQALRGSFQEYQEALLHFNMPET